MGRPTDYNEDTLAEARAYLDGGYESAGQQIPSIAGLARVLGLSRETLRKWAADAEKAEFVGIFESIQAEQEIQLVNKGLSGDFNPTISKLILTKHGYSDKQQSEVSGPDGGEIPTSLTIKFGDG